MRTILLPVSMITVGLFAAGCSGSPAAPAGSAGASASPGSGEALPTAITFTTNRGPITVSTDPGAPRTVIAQSTLAESGYFDNTPCHRLVTKGIFVLQCGDPTGTGTGGPGYQLPDENLPAAARNNYPKGTVAMANAGPNTGGSQFFLVYQDTTLPPNYTVWGTVTEGLDVVRKIASRGTTGGATDGSPKEPVTIESTSVN